MNKKLSACSTVAWLGLVLLVGCEAARTKPPSVWPSGGIITLARKPPMTEGEILSHAAAQPPGPVEGNGWQALFDGRSLAGWRVTPFNGSGRVECRKGLIILYPGDSFTGVTCTNEVPKINYEVALEAMRVAGDDCFCDLTFPVRDSLCSLVIGGVGGEVVGLSNLDGVDALENETSEFISFETGYWYRLRLRVTEHKIEAWIEQKKVVDVVITGRKLSLPDGGPELSAPFGLATLQTTAAVREIKIRRVAGPAEPAR